jgi:hypothetical protein
MGWSAQMVGPTHLTYPSDCGWVALANELERMAWAVHAKNEQYRPSVSADVAAAWRVLRRLWLLVRSLANKEMAQRLNPTLSKPELGRGLSRLYE